MYAKYAALRDKKGISDYKVSQDTGVLVSTLSDWKAGRYSPKIDKIMKLADYFGVSVEYFLETEETT